MTLKNNRAPLLSNIKLYASFHQHMWIQTGVTVRKRLSWVMTSVTLTFDLWPWPFAWTSLLSLVITPENFMMIRWWEHGEKGVTDGQTDRRTDGLNQSYSCLVAAKKFFYHILFDMKLLNYLFCDMFGSVLECYELTHISWLSTPGNHAWLNRHCYPIGCIIKSTHQGICSCSPIVNFFKFTFHHGMATSVIFLIKN